MRRLTEKDERRFWALVALPDADGHMMWMGAPGTGYGTFRALGMNWVASRVSLFLTGGVPTGVAPWALRYKYALHAPIICHTPGCVAPRHLRWGGPMDNAADARLDAAYSQGRTEPIKRNFGVNQYSTLKAVLGDMP